MPLCRHKVKRVVYYSDEEESSSNEVQYIWKCKRVQRKTITREAPLKERTKLFEVEVTDDHLSEESETEIIKAWKVDRSKSKGINRGLEKPKPEIGLS